MSAGLIVGAFFIGILAILFLIMLHEFGHFLVAKLTGAFVYEFSVGFGPRIFTYKGKETWYSIRIIPLGGFVSIASDRSDPPVGREDEADLIPDERKMEYTKRWKKALFIIAGPLMNFLFAVFLITTIFMATLAKPNDMSFYGQRFDDTSIAYKAIKENEPELKIESQNFVITGWEAYLDEPSNIIFTNIEGGVQTDETISDGGMWAPNYRKIVYNFINAFDKDIFKKQDNFEKIYIRFSYRELIVPHMGKFKAEDFKTTQWVNDSSSWKANNKISVGITPPSRIFKNTTQAYAYGWKETGEQTIALLKAFGQLFTGNIKALSGPLGMANQTANMIKAPDTFFLYVAGISANLFMLNMLPIPPLDGYKFLENAAEAVVRKELSGKYKIIAYSIGAILFIGLFLIITLKDLFLG